MQSLEADFEVSNFTCTWSADSADPQLLVLVGKELFIISPINGSTKKELDSADTATVSWVRDLKGTSHSLVALAAGNTVTIRDCITWAIVAKNTKLFDTEDELGEPFVLFLV